MVNVNWNADNRKWNVNTYNRNDNRWNTGNRVFSLETIKVLLKYYAWGVFDSNPFFQPPTMRPSSSTFSEMRIYFLLSKALNSQETSKKNFNTSVFLMAMSMVGNFSLLLW